MIDPIRYELAARAFDCEPDTPERELSLALVDAYDRGELAVKRDIATGELLFSLALVN